MVYLDWAATALPDEQIIQEMLRVAVEYPGNPSAQYRLGKEAREVLETARTRCAAVLGCRAERLVFTSGGSEGNAIALLSCLKVPQRGTILISAVEHPSSMQPVRALEALGWTVKTIAPGSDGRISPESLLSALEKHPDTRLVSIMAVNNETGAVQPLQALTAAARTAKRPLHFHADMVQAAGKIPVNLGTLDVDSASFSAHKIRGPRGTGLFYHKNPQFEAFIKGGGQEHGVRPGTENVAGAAAMAMALEKWGKPLPETALLGKWLLEELTRIPGARIIPAEREKSSETDKYAPSIIPVSFPPVPGEVLARVLGEKGFAVSTGSACSNNRKGKGSRILKAMNTDRETAEGMIRISIGPASSRDEIERFLEALRESAAQLSLMSRRPS